MADIELIIKIPEEVYKNIQSKSTEIQAEGYTVENTILNGTPLNEVLDNIRAEIEELKPNNPNFKGYYEQNVALNKVLDIIDKYKAEKENE